MSKRFNGIAIAKDLGQDIGSDSSVLENVKGVLYAENINSVVYYDKNLNLLGSSEAPTKKFTASLVNSPTVNYGDVQNVKYIDISVGNSKEQEADDWIILHTDMFRFSEYNLLEAFNEAAEEAGEDPNAEGFANYVSYSGGNTIYVCNPAMPEYTLSWNGQKYYLWKYLDGDLDLSGWEEDDSCTWFAYFLTSIADYDILKSKSMKYLGNVDGYSNSNSRVYSYIPCLRNINIASLDTDLHEHYKEGGNWGRGTDTTPRIVDVTHFKGLYFTAPETFHVEMNHNNGDRTNNPNIQYSINYGLTWRTWNGSELTLDPNTIIMFRGNNPQGFCKYYIEYSEIQYSYFVISTESLSPTIEAHGNIMSLIDNGACNTTALPTIDDIAGGFFGLFQDCDYLISTPELPATTLSDHCYAYIFCGCTALTKAPALHATSLTNSCYSNMFRGCTALTEAPTLPAISLAEFCYSYMFSGCTSLTEAPTLPAISLAEFCYSYMFLGCTSLTEAPALQATSLAEYCYVSMFYGCTSLTKAPVLSATSLASSCYSYMFYNCTTLSEAPVLPAINLANDCYSYMFENCTALTEAPALPATSLANYCYNGMFRDCTSLTEAPALPETSLANYCYSNMFLGCTSLTEAPALPATSLANGCYANMFYGCKNLSYISCNATTNITTTNCNNWVNGVALYGTFVKNYSSPAWSIGVSGVPTNWVLSVPAVDNQATNFVSIHILLDPEIETPSITISFPAVSSNHTLQYTKTVGGWSLPVSTSSLAVTITGTEILYLRGTLTGNNSTNNYTNILITSSNGSKAILSGNCNAIWNYNSPTTGLSYLYYGYNLFKNSSALVKVNKKFLVACSLSSRCYSYMFYGCTALTEAPILPATSLTDYCYSYMFLGCTSLTEAPALPATSLANYCYSNMFLGCTSLTKAPVLSATSLASSCYSGMFYNCTTLSEAPVLPAINLANDCYYNMFAGCTALTEAPVLPATSLANYCYSYMFVGCTSLTEAPALPATSLANKCYNGMFYNCRNLSYISCNATTNITTSNCNMWLYNVKSSGTFYKNSSATWPTGSTSGIPSGWNSISLNNINSENNCIEIRLIGTSDVTITFVKISTNHTLQYKDNNHNSWTNASAGNTITLSYSNNPVVLLKGNLSAANTGSNYTLITISGGASTLAKLTGNCNYLWNSDPDAELKNYCGYRLFYGSTAITKVSKNFLPATSLADYCYSYMFYGCTALTEAPALPATSLADSCYNCMFSNCTALTEAPALPATNLTNLCYYYMFENCTALTEAPALPATSLADSCYNCMLKECTSLTEAPALPATSLADYCYSYMFENCTALTEAPALPATSLAFCCYNGMFSNCTALTEAPALPATSLADSCYSSMFEICTSLTEAPALPATSLADGCYSSMFDGCTALAEAPALPATSLVDGCYSYMFYGCTSLTEAPALPATSLASSCYYGMFYGCTSLTEAPALPATSLASSCYYGMFYGCTSLVEAICFAITNSYTNSTTNWLANASSSGKIYSKTTTNISVPSGWTIQIF